MHAKLHHSTYLLSGGYLLSPCRDLRRWPQLRHRRGRCAPLLYPGAELTPAEPVTTSECFRVGLLEVSNDSPSQGGQSTNSQGRDAGAVWITGSNYHPCRAPCGMAAPAGAIFWCCAVESAHLLGIEPKPLCAGLVSRRDAGFGAVNACPLIRHVYARAPCASRALRRSGRAAWCPNATGIV